MTWKHPLSQKLWFTKGTWILPDWSQWFYDYDKEIMQLSQGFSVLANELAGDQTRHPPTLSAQHAWE